MLSFLYAASVNFQDAANNANLAGSETTFAEWLARIFSAVLSVAALLVLIYLVWGAITWITSAGDPANIKKARDRMTQAIIGLLVLVATTAIFMMVQSALGIELINFTGGTTQTQNNEPRNPNFWGRTRRTIE